MSNPIFHLLVSCIQILSLTVLKQQQLFVYKFEIWTEFVVMTHLCSTKISVRKAQVSGSGIFGVLFSTSLLHVISDPSAWCLYLLVRSLRVSILVRRNGNDQSLKA